MAIVSPLVLSLYGRDYKTHSSTLLILLSMATLPKAITTMSISVARVRQNIGRVVALQATQALGFVGLSVLFLGSMGITGVGVAALITHGTLALANAPTLIRAMRSDVDTARDVADRPNRFHWPIRWWPMASIVAALTIWAILLWTPLLGRIDPSGAGSLGLVNTLPMPFYACLILLVIGGAGSLCQRKIRASFVTVSLAAAVTILHGTTSIIEPLPRFATGWLHVGFSDYIARTGATLPHLDARFNWPGFFSLAAFVSRLAGPGSLMAFLRWAPPFWNALYLIPLYSIAASLGLTRRQRWVAVWLFLVVNWVGQDYFAPQAENYLLLLVLIAVVLRWFGDDGRRAGWRRLPLLSTVVVSAGSLVGRIVGTNSTDPVRDLEIDLVLDQRDVVTTSPRRRFDGQRTFLLAISAAVFATTVISHQLTPIVAFVMLVGLVATGYTTLRGAPLLMGILVAAWVSWAAVAFWSGHLHSLFGGLGQFSSTVDANVSRRVARDNAHILVIYTRMAVAAGAWLLAIVGAVRLARRRRLDRRAVVLALAPFAVLGAQSYGGEALLRVYLFSLAPTVVLAAAAFVPDTLTTAKNIARTGALTVLSLAAVFGFMLARFGNEQFEYSSPADLEAINWVYDHAPVGSLLVAPTPNLPWRYRDVEAYDYTTPASGFVVTNPSSIETFVATRLARPAATNTAGTAARQAFLIVTRSSVAWGQLMDGRGASWAYELAEDLSHRGHFDIAFGNDDAVVLRYVALIGGS